MADDYEIHPAADLFPKMTGKEFTDLVAIIKNDGINIPILTYQGKIIDGRNRYLACKKAGVEPRFEEWAGEEKDVVKTVIRFNLFRRHLSESQRASIAAKIAQTFKEDAAQRRKATQNNDAGKAVSANLREQPKGKATEQAAAVMNVSPRSVEAASKVQKKGVPELAAKVESGEISVNSASKIAGKPPEEQKQLLSVVPSKKSSKSKVGHKSKEIAPDAGQNLIREFEAKAVSLRTMIEDAQADKWTHLPREIVRKHLEAFNAVLNGGRTCVKAVPVSEVKPQQPPR
jgi:hypothetical protein